MDLDEILSYIGILLVGIVFIGLLINPIYEEFEAKISEDPQVKCDYYAKCDDIKFNPLTKIYNFCGLELSEQELKRSCLSKNE